MSQSEQIVFLDADTIGHDCEWPDFSQLGRVSFLEKITPLDIPQKAANATILLTNKVPISKETIKALPNLRYIGAVATGFNIIDLEAATAQNIPVCNAPGYSTPSVVQHTFALILDLFSRITLHANAVASGAWSLVDNFCFWLKAPIELNGKTLGILGYGHIGSQVAQIGHCFGMHIIAYNPRPKTPPSIVPFTFVSLDELFQQADVLSLHCPLTAENRNIVNATRLKQMKKTAFLINCARGGLVHEKDLYEALLNGDIAGAGLDVLSQEPMPENHFLSHAPNCLITPHIAWSTPESRSRLLQIVFTNIQNFLQGTPSNMVNPVSLVRR